MSGCGARGTAKGAPVHEPVRNLQALPVLVGAEGGAQGCRIHEPEEEAAGDEPQERQHLAVKRISPALEIWRTAFLPGAAFEARTRDLDHQLLRLARPALAIGYTRIHDKQRAGPERQIELRRLDADLAAERDLQQVEIKRRRNDLDIRAIAQQAD